MDNNRLDKLCPYYPPTIAELTAAGYRVSPNKTKRSEPIPKDPIHKRLDSIEKLLKEVLKELKKAGE